jgi:hypothetical protein
MSKSAWTGQPAIALARHYLSAAQFHTIDSSPSLAFSALAQAAAQIALVEQRQEQNEHLEQIRNHLDDISTVLRNAEGAGGAIKIDVLE